MSTEPRCIPLDALGDLRAGGKAEGLARLIALGLDVPPGFVVVGASEGQMPEDLRIHLDALDGPVAVRSSASGEDSSEASFAGQHETFLEVEGESAVADAIARCVASLDLERADAYRSTHAADAPKEMFVVVQRMVDARVSGVLFTADPISGRRDRMILDAVEGLGEALVSGERTPDHHLLTRRGRIVHREIAGEFHLLDDSVCKRLADDANRAERAAGHPLDLEWAIDARGQIHWLQARPITGLPGDLQALDTRPTPGHLYTRCNIGEMMPGAVTPLTFSLTGRGIDQGMQSMYAELGALDGVEPRLRFVSMAYGHLFLNLTELASLSRFVIGSTAEDAALSVCGREVPELRVDPPRPTAERALGAMRYARYLTTGRRREQALRRTIASLVLARGDDALTTYRHIDARVPDLYEAYAHHLCGSAKSGALVPVLLRIASDNEVPTAAHHAEVAALLAGAEDVESADIAQGIGRVAKVMRSLPDIRARFVDASTEEALAFLRSDAAGAAREAFAAYLARHGHRAVREAEFRQPEWREDPTPLVVNLQAALRREARPAPSSSPVAPSASRIPPRLVAIAQAGVRERESTKSALIEITAHFKQAYRALAAQMVEAKLLDDADQLFFFTHEELGSYLRAPDLDGWRDTLEARRSALPFQMKLQFPDVFEGVPGPLDPIRSEAPEGGLAGKPVSRGVVRGKARVAFSPDEAAAVERGEILVAPITDVGWTPCFEVIAGLATDIGSAVSHGAVVAREYGLPAVVDLRNATSVIRTGDYVELDGDAGTLRVIEAIDG